MGPAFLTVLLWSYCVIATRRSVVQLGENQANVARILVAVVSLGVIAHFWGWGLGGGGLLFFFLSGVVGFGIGDIGLFYALPRIGSRLTLLMAQCLAAPIAGFAEWWWLGTTLSWGQVLAVAIILLGVVIAVGFSGGSGTVGNAGRMTFLIGIAFGLLAAVGQGVGAVLSRKAYVDAAAVDGWVGAEGITGGILMGATSGYQRLLGGTLVIVTFYLASLVVKSWRTRARKPYSQESAWSKGKYILLTAYSGPVLGIICFQWALASTPSAIVQPIIAMTPLAVLPMTALLEGERPSRQSIIGSVISVGGVILLAFS
jgi:drug/metabolite transporter (DMT)-like permease